MAQQANSKMVRGMIGNVIFQEHTGKQIIRSRPSRVRQTKATKSSAGEFGKSSSWAKALRVGLKPFLTDWADKAFYRRLTSGIYNAICANMDIPKGQRNLYNTNLDLLIGLDCNVNTPWSKWFLGELNTAQTAERQIRITVSELVTNEQVLYPEGCSNAELVLYVMATNAEQGGPVTAYHTTVPLLLSDTLIPEMDWITPALPENTIAVATAQLLFYDNNSVKGKHYHNNDKLNPSTWLWVGATA